MSRTMMTKREAAILNAAELATNKQLEMAGKILGGMIDAKGKSVIVTLPDLLATAQILATNSYVAAIEVMINEEST